MGLFFLKYFTIALALAAPIGPMSLLCMRRTLNYGIASGIVTGAAIATIDCFYCASIAFGLNFISDFAISHKSLFACSGGLVMIYFGTTIFFTKFSERNIEINHRNLYQDYISGAILTLFNPITIFSYMAVFAGLGFGSANVDYQASSIAVLAVFLGSISWYCFFVFSLNLLRNQFDEKVTKIVNRSSGLVVIGFGIATILKSIL